MTVREYIASKWDKSLRTQGHRKDGIELPFPYTSPCAEGIFDEFYYWDTCFLNKGLIADGKIEQALNNVRNVAFLIEKFGFMPNAAVDDMTNRSQPPLFAMMCNDVLRATKDETLLKEFFPMLRTEYSFWMNNRVLPCGLNRYGNNADYNTKIYMADLLESRLQKTFPQDIDRIKLGDDTLAECESGWDFSPRFGLHCTKFAPVDLNSILYDYEITLARFAPDLKTGAKFVARAKTRKEKIYRYLFDGSKFLDGVPSENSFGKVVSVASAAPFVFGISDDAKILKETLKLLECENGISACEKTDGDAVYQWGYPNMWAPLVWFMFEALLKNDLLSDAKRIGLKYLAAVDKTFDSSGKLWEKYDAVTGEKSGLHEYTETEMLGWTAGVYNVIYDTFYKKR